jgi:hypothetical protein
VESGNSILIFIKKQWQSTFLMHAHAPGHGGGATFF